MSNLQGLLPRSCEALQSFLRKIGLQDQKTTQWRPANVILFTLAVLCAVLPLTINQLVLAVVLAIAYALSQEYQVSRNVSTVRDHGLAQPNTVAHARRRTAPVASALLRRTTPEPAAVKAPLRRFSAPPGLEEPASLCTSSAPPGLEEEKKDTSEVQVASPPGLTRPVGLDKEVDALLATILPTPASDRMVKELARTVQQTISPTFPEANVLGFSTGDLACNASVGMCMPEVDLVVNINPDALPGQLRGRLARTGGASTEKLDARKVQKSAIRACTDRLVSDSGFKFRRSAFKGQEPKITLLAPSTFTGRRMGSSLDAKRGSLDEAAVPVDLSVNNTTPHRTDAILRTCRQFDARAQALIVLVRRWARDRGICHAAKGHLSPYAWSVLAAFYLQVAPAGEAPCLPALQGAELGSAGPHLQQAQSKAAAKEWKPAGAGVDYSFGKSQQRKTVATLFREFVLFYLKDFNWRHEAASLHVGRRAAPELALPLHIFVTADGVPMQIGLSIQDPFDRQTNLGTSMTAEGFTRMQEELLRAVNLLAGPEPSLAELLEPWVSTSAEPIEKMEQ